MKVLMLGWEFPPINSGGLGVASTNIAKHIAEKHDDINIHFAIPTFIYQQLEADHHPNEYSVVELEKLESLTICAIKSSIHSPYVTEKEYQQIFQKISAKNNQLKNLYGENLFHEIERFAQEVASFAQDEHYDLIHAHDWITFKAGILAKEVTGAPLVVHVHATEIDRTGGNPSPGIYEYEQAGLHAADHVISVSEYTRAILQKHYRVPARKITAVHNGIDNINHCERPTFKPEDKIILFLGRVTIQKGPDYFLEVARKVVKNDPHVKFVIGGTGDMLPKIMSRIIEYGLQENVFCVGFIRGEQKEKAFKKARLYMMPSVSEPFGLSALEAVNANIPTVLCKQSGVSEVINNSFKSDFWDVERMANQVLAVIKYPAISSTMIPAAKQELRRCSWRNQVDKVALVYRSLI